MPTAIKEKGLETHITQYCCLVNAFEERHFNDTVPKKCVK